MWEKLEAAFKAKETVKGKVVDRIKGGLVVDIGVRAFLPGSQYDLRPTANLDDLMGQEMDVRITKLNRRRGNVVVSRRALLEEGQLAKRAELMESLKEGADRSRTREKRDGVWRVRGPGRNRRAAAPDGFELGTRKASFRHAEAGSGAGRCHPEIR